MVKNLSPHLMRRNLAVNILVMGVCMLFLTLMMGLFVYRFSMEFWPPLGFASLSLNWPIISSVMILSSSLCYVFFERKKNRLFSTLAFLLGTGFLFSQQVVWSELNAIGINQGSGAYGSLLFGFTWIHFAHIVIGLLMFIFPLKIWKKNEWTETYQNSVLNVGKFWHCLMVIWIPLFLGLFII